jgi:acyl dehydratase
MPTLTYSTLADAAGTDLGHSRWILVDQDRIDAFADITEDRQWIHTDPDRAARGPFGSTIAHGYLTLSLVAAFLEELLQLDGAGMSINYGTDRVRFPQPVKVGSRVRGHGLITDVIAVGTSLQACVRVTVATDNADKPACVTDVLIRVLPKPPAGSSDTPGTELSSA